MIDAEIVRATERALVLEERARGLFGVKIERGGSRLFGGLVAAQTVIAAGQTVDAGRRLHSLHGTFLRPGTAAEELLFEVERLRDGGSYSARRVSVRQSGKLIFAAQASFAEREAGAGRQELTMPQVPGPEGLADREAHRAERYREVFGIDQPPYKSAVEVRLCDPQVVEPGKSQPPEQNNWLRWVGALAEDPLLQSAALVYASDRCLLATARLPYDVGRHRLLSVSLDHVVWLHRVPSMSEWHLHTCRSPVERSGRGLIESRIYDQTGACVATVMQEGLVRILRDP